MRRRGHGRGEIAVVLLLALTFSTGVIDAAGFLGLDRVFTGNMTGNVAILGMALAGADGLPVIGPIVALIAFIVGAALAGRVLRGGLGGWTGATTALLATVAALLLLAAVAAALPIRLSEITTYALTALLGVAMGLQAGAARAVAAKDLTTVVVTSTLVGLAYDSRLGAGRSHPWVRRLLAVAFLAAGALAGAALLAVHFAWSAGLAAAVTALVALIGERRRRLGPSPGGGAP